MRKNFICLCLLLIFPALLACGSAPVKHYASDVCLLKKGETTRQDILALLGKPNTIQNSPDGTENWYYYNVKENYMGKIPYVGKKWAKKELETIKIELKGDLVTSCYFIEEVKK